MSFFSGGSSSVTSTSTAVSTVKDIEVSDPPPDSISSLSWSPQADFLAAASWDNNVRIYEVSSGGQTQGKAMFSHEGPVLSVSWSKDGTKVISGGADKAARMFDVQTGQTTQVAAHDGPIKSVKWIDAQNGILATGSWDKTLKFWDLRTPNPISLESTLRMQTRVVACFPAADGFAIGSIEGRVAITYVDEKASSSENFSFKCHRRDQSSQNKNQTLVFAVNDISFHQQHGTFSTAGSDGSLNFWDKDSRTRLKIFDPAPAPITCTSFNHTGTIFAYAVSYDWSKGHGGNVPGLTNKIMLHPCKEEEVKKKPPKK
ncbi:hypothetical protein Clacol_007337 [Clathrus columnatus]|uniref:Anaphase-promoting complex subunit 4-like WD40 domain-containing protein n=1 Tax=Clathrus columnatus TaxID=1419009 RepID=A0AAV5AH76_9AGAM|nr:hypothetical protein Clacol_007337 [Clathrus columnatus]